MVVRNGRTEEVALDGTLFVYPLDFLDILDGKVNCSEQGTFFPFLVEIKDEKHQSEFLRGFLPVPIKITVAIVWSCSKSVISCFCSTSATSDMTVFMNGDTKISVII